jgi:hypothetical protein
MRLSLVFCLAALAIEAALTLPARAALPLRTHQEDGAELATKSTLVPIRLPQGAFRSTNREDIESLRRALPLLARTENATIDTVEVLVWSAGTKPMGKLSECLKEGGYSYTTRPAFKADPGKITPLSATRRDNKDSIVGVWIETADRMTLLVWGIARSEAIDASPPTAPTASSLLGEWTWTTISSVNYKDQVTGALAAPSGMSVRFNFLPDGRYRMLFFVRQRTYGTVSEATTTEEGKVTFGGTTFVLTPSKGHYKGFSAGGNPIDRDMATSELKTRTYHWEWRGENNKRQLYMGPGAGSLSPFKRP